MKVIKTKKLDILKCWLSGGQCDYMDRMGSYAEGFDWFNLREDEEADKDLKTVKENIILCIEQFGDDKEDEPFYYWGDHYRFSMPCEKNLDILAKRIYKELKYQREEMQEE